MTMITPSYLGETIEYSSLHACRSTLEDPTRREATQGTRRKGHQENPVRAGKADGHGEAKQIKASIERRVGAGRGTATPSTPTAEKASSDSTTPCVRSE